MLMLHSIQDDPPGLSAATLAHAWSHRFRYLKPEKDAARLSRS